MHDFSFSKSLHDSLGFSDFSRLQQEPEWDVSSAFFANAASHIRPKGSSRKSKENKENEARREVSANAGRRFTRTAVQKSTGWEKVDCGLLKPHCETLLCFQAAAVAVFYC